jgi:hypothetical protein
MKTLSEKDRKKALTFGQAWAEIIKLRAQPYCRKHRGESGIWAAFLLVVGALVRWIPGLRGSGHPRQNAE